MALTLPGLLLEGRAQIFTSTVPFNVVPLPKQDTSVTSPTPSVYLVRASSNSTEETQNIFFFSLKLWTLAARCWGTEGGSCETLGVKGSEH
ncbi:hypothetical protein BFJ69_g10577 [Fusarium oxysporum]|uniref:Uncharacterized protein n=1 Tax=Fusarium oxysporum TaxID=5507 RepID=A0A420MV93_FUSOX|nr:hypothetical protein BFJ69_g10577 [Fusarium oxysporum]